MEECRYAGNDKGKEQRLDDAAPNKPFDKHVLQAVFQIYCRHDTAEPASTEGTYDTGEYTERHHQWNGCHHSGNFR